MGLNGRDLLRERHSPESHYIALSRLYEDLAGLSQKSVKPHPKERPPVRVAFIGGRGVISKYSGIETYYEEVGRRLAANGDDVTVYCRNYFRSEERRVGKECRL